MKKIILFLSFLILFSGCTQMYNSNEVSLSDVNTELSYQTGVVEDVKHVVIKDDGSGVFVGAYTGTVLGSMFGKGKGNILSTLLGGLAGAFVGYKADKANAEELFIRLDDGRNVVVIVKGVDIHKGDRVRLIKRGTKIVRVEKI
jgi:outer membrane lipoprotein SlyB